MRARILQAINDSINLKSTLLDESGVEFIIEASRLILSKLHLGGKVLICGNGGSAADAQHFAAEFVGRFMVDRAALPAIALTTDTSILTAVGNDYSFDDVFSRQVSALCNSNDVLIGISTSGKSKNIVNALEMAKKKGAKTITLLGGTGGSCIWYADYKYIVPSSESARIQEVHLLIEHLICEIVEKSFISNEK